MSNRLESLNTKKPGSSQGPKPGLKFKPKVVQRKSKEERAKEAPTVKQEPQVRTPANRGRGSTRGRGRGGRNNYAGTHLVSSGPLSAGSVSIGNVSGSKLGLTSDTIYNSSISPTPEFLQNLKLKDRPKSVTPGAESDEEDDDPTKINMTQQYRFADEETVLFPVRPERIIDENKALHPVTKSEEPESIRGTPSATASREPTVKLEPGEERVGSVGSSELQLEHKQQATVVDSGEQNKFITDQQQILDLLTDKLSSLSTEENEGAKDDKYVLFQLPNHLPKYKQKFNVKEEQEDKSIVDAEESIVSEFASNSSSIRGQIGHVNIHQSGKITMDLGNGNILSITKGAPTSFLQEVAILDINPPANENEDVQMMDEEGRKIGGKIIRLGTIDETIIATPYIQ